MTIGEYWMYWSVRSSRWLPSMWMTVGMCTTIAIRLFTSWDLYYFATAAVFLQLGFAFLSISADWVRRNSPE